MSTDDTPGDGESDEQDDDAGEDDVGTENPRFRWAWLSTFVSLFTVVVFTALIVFHAFGVVDMSGLNAYLLGTFVLAYIGSIGYAIGTDTLKEVKELRGAP